MKLSDYLSEAGETYAAFAERVGAANASVVHKWIAGLRVPRRKAMAAIVRETDGKVQPNDFLELQDA
jgi:hypothetical protein